MPSGDSGLGRTLESVLARTVRREPGRGYLEVDIGLIRPSTRNPRSRFDEAALNELADSIRQHGILQPLVVLKVDPGYEILAGERRWRAAKLAGLAKVPVVVRDGEDPRHQAELRLVENLQRQDLNPIEVAKAYQALIETHDLTHEDVAARVNKDRASVSNALRLLGLPAPLQEAVASGGLAMGHARALLGCTDAAWQKALAARIEAEGLPVRAVERLAKAGPPTAAAVADRPVHIREQEQNLQRLFGARVRIREKGGKGAVTVAFDSLEHYQRVVSILDRAIRGANQELAKGSLAPPPR